jgi:hypothetical protein
LVKLIGEHVEHTGVVPGMSGSPLYIDGKLIGALSYQLGLFQKDPIAGVTPIADMLAIVEQDKHRDREMAAKKGLNPNFVAVAAGLAAASYENLLPAYLSAPAESQVASEIRPLQMPIYASGFESAALQLSSELFGRQGFAVYQGGGGTSGNTSVQASDLRPGSAYSVVLVEGDYSLQATGTVTHVDGDRVLGMGHPFLNAGAVGLPMGQAKILTTLSSLMSSTKMASLTNLVGTIHQDRTTGVLGVTGKQPQMIPCRIRLSSDLFGTSEFEFSLAEDRSLHSFTPFLFSIVLSSSLESARLSLSNQTLVLNGAIHLKNGEQVPLQNYYAGSTPAKFVTDAIEATGEVAAILGTLLSNDFESPHIAGIDLNFTILHKKYLASIQSVELDKTVVRPGEKVKVTVHLKEFQGAEHVVRHTIEVPSTLKERRVSLVVGSSDTVTRLEHRISPQKYRPENIKQLMHLLNSRRANNYVFFQLRARNAGVVASGQELPGLPPSVMSVMNTQRASGNMQILRERILSEDAVQVDFSVSGGKALLISVDKHK